MTVQRQRRTIGIAVGVLAIGVATVLGAGFILQSSPTTATPSPQASSASPSASQVAQASPSQEASPSASASSSPTASPTATPSPTPPVVAGWSKPKLVASSTDCFELVAGIDASSGDHLAASCRGKIRYFSSKSDGSWVVTNLPPPAHRLEQTPQIGFQGNTVYLAYSRVLPDEGCGGGAPDVGVYYRYRRLPDGVWSNPIRLGLVGDRLQSFRVNGTTLHATVRNDATARVYYETREATGEYHRYWVKGAIGGTSLRIASDGEARIAFEAANSIRFGIFTGAGFDTTKVGGSKPDDWSPNLVLDGNDDPHITWSRNPHGGCAVREALPDDGTYYATNASGPWTYGRIAKNVGQSSIQIDGTTGLVHVVISGNTGLGYYTKTPTAGWRATLLRGEGAEWPLIRLDPATGRLLVAYFAATPDASAFGGIYVLTKP